jgi:hypothetical protein
MRDSEVRDRFDGAFSVENQRTTLSRLRWCSDPDVAFGRFSIDRNVSGPFLPTISTRSVVPKMMILSKYVLFGV